MTRPHFGERLALESAANEQTSLSCGLTRPRYVHRITPPALFDFWEALFSLPAYVGLFRVFVLRQISVRYRQSILGILWVVLQPLATTIILLFMFQIIGAQASKTLPAGMFLFVGVVTWQFFSRGVQDGTMSLRNNSQIITKIYFPRLVLPISGVATAWFEILVMLLLLLLVCLVQGIPLSPRIALLPAFLVLISFVALSLSLWLAPINALARDITFMLPIALQFGMYASPVLYSGNLVPERWKLLFYLNPMSTLIEGVRWSLFRDEPAPDPTLLALNVVIMLALLVSGLIAFQKLEPVVIDRI
jgi:lipopolysaccharide transport system permease protein